MVYNYIRFARGSAAILIDLPLYGYTSKVSFPFYGGKTSGGGYRWFDNGATYDIREWECEFQLTLSQFTTFINFFLDDTKGRASSSVTLSLYANSGVFPFGPDKGDVGPFTVGLKSISRKEHIFDESRTWRVSCVFTNVGSYPAYSLPSEISDGLFQIGTISGIRYPKISPKILHRWDAQSNPGGATNFVQQSSTDDYSADIEIIGNSTKMAALINYLTGTARAAQFTVTSQNDFYLFGLDKGSSGAYSVKLAQTELDILNINAKQFSMPLHLSLDT